MDGHGWYNHHRYGTNMDTSIYLTTILAPGMPSISSHCLIICHHFHLPIILPLHQPIITINIMLTNLAIPLLSQILGYYYLITISLLFYTISLIITNLVFQTYCDPIIWLWLWIMIHHSHHYPTKWTNLDLHSTRNFWTMWCVLLKLGVSRKSRRLGCFQKNMVLWIQPAMRLQWRWGLYMSACVFFVFLWDLETW